jgi:hypothetical protein
MKNHFYTPQLLGLKMGILSKSLIEKAELLEIAATVIK